MRRLARLSPTLTPTASRTRDFLRSFPVVSRRDRENQRLPNLSSRSALATLGSRVSINLPAVVVVEAIKRAAVVVYPSLGSRRQYESPSSSRLTVTAARDVSRVRE